MMFCREIAERTAQRVADETGKVQWLFWVDGRWNFTGKPGEWFDYRQAHKIEPQRKEWTE